MADAQEVATHHKVVPERSGVQGELIKNHFAHFRCDRVFVQDGYPPELKRHAVLQVRD